MPEEKKWTQPTTSIMKQKWGGSNNKTLLIREGIRLVLLVGAILSIGLLPVKSSGIFASLILMVLLLNWFVSATITRFTQPGKEIEEANRLLLEKIKQEVKWHPAAFALVYSAATHGVNVYKSDDLDDIIQDIRVWVVSNAYKEKDCFGGHHPLCRHNAAEIYQWANAPIIAPNAEPLTAS